MQARLRSTTRRGCAPSTNDANSFLRIHYPVLVLLIRFSPSSLRRKHATRKIHPKWPPQPQDVILGLGFLLLAAASLKRLLATAGQTGSEAVITTFYSLIFFTSAARTLWFLIPTRVCVHTALAFRGSCLPGLCVCSALERFLRSEQDSGILPFLLL